MERVNDILNNLITINKSRIVAYKEAIHDTDESREQMRGVFKKIQRQSENYIEELKEKIKESGSEVTDKTTTTALVYNAWMDIIYSGADNKPAVEDFCKQVEEDTLQVYEADLVQMEQLDKDIYQMILRQKQDILEAGKEIKDLFYRA